MDMTLVIAALTGSGGIVALVTVLLQHRQKMTELQTIHAKTNLQLEQIKSKQIPLEYHPLFTTLEELEHFFMWSFELEDLGRTMVIRELCVNKLRVWKTVLKQYVTDGEACYGLCGSGKRDACNKTELIFRKMLLEGLEGYSILWDINHKMDIYGRVVYDQKSFDSMHKFIPIFQEWHSSREEMVRLAAHDIPNCGINNDCYGDWWDMLTVYMYAFTQMKYDALNAMKTLNGEMTGGEIFGVTIGDIH